MAETSLNKNVIGFPTLLATAVGLVIGATTLVTVCQGQGQAGYNFIWAQLIGFVLMIFSAMSFLELGLMLPKAGSIAAYTELAMGHFPAIIATIAGYVIVQLLAGPADLAITGMVCNMCFYDGLSPRAFSVILLCLFGTLNLFGVDIFAKGQITFTVIMLAALGFLGVTGAVLGGNPAIPVVTPPMGIADIFSLVAMGIWLLVGAEFCLPLIEEAKNPKKNIPLAMFLGLAIILVFQGFFGMQVSRYLSADRLVGSPIPHIEAATAMLGTGGKIFVAIATLFASASTINTLLAAVPRMLYGMAQIGQVPRIFAYLHPRFRTPWVGIILLGGGMLVQLQFGISTAKSIIVFIVAAAFSWLLAYIIAHIDVVILRYKYPEIERPFKTPFYPIPQILGSVGLVYVMFNIFPDPEIKTRIYKWALCFLAGAALYSLLWTILKMKVNPFSSTKLDNLVIPQSETSE
jgi:amino acid transporter